MFGQAASPSESDKWRTILMVMVAVLGVAVLVGLILILREADRQRDRALAWQSHSYEVMVLARSLSETTAQAEASLGRYVISGERSMGQIYSQEWQKAGFQIDRLAIATDDNARQEHKVGLLRDAFTLRGQELARVAWYTLHGKNREAYAFFNSARDTPALHELTKRLNDFITGERELLRERSDKANAAVAQSTEIAGVLGLFGLALIFAAIALAWGIARARADQAIATAEADVERARAETLSEAVKEATQKLHAEARERVAAEARLRQAQKMEAVGQLTGGIAHDFNNMLAVVLGGLDLAKRQMDRGTGDPRRHLDNAMEGASRAAALTRRLLAFSRADALTPEAVEPNGVIDGMFDLLERTLGEQIAIHKQVHACDWQIWADRNQLENALVNLAVNARDAMNGCGTLRFTTDCVVLQSGEVGQCPAGEYVSIAVTDTGCGMTPEVLERVYEPFFTTKPVGKGTGLGLSQVFGFVRQSQGEVAIRSAPGEGTCVTLYLPRHIPMAADQQPPASAIKAISPKPGEDLDILVVEDDPRVLTATVDALTELGHHPVACIDPLKAQEIAATMPKLDCIVSDVLMPGRTGPEMVEEMKNIYPRAAVVFVTGYAGEEADRLSLAGHIVVRKPFTMTALADAVQDAVHSPPRSPDRMAASA